MIETYELDEHGNLTITWLAENRDDEAELKEYALAIVRGEAPVDANQETPTCE